MERLMIQGRVCRKSVDRREGPGTHKRTEGSLEREETEGVSLTSVRPGVPNATNSSHQCLPPNGRVNTREIGPALLTTWDSMDGGSSQACQDAKPTSRPPVFPPPLSWFQEFP